MPIWAQMKENSATTSRAAVPSIEFSTESVNPRARRYGAIHAEGVAGERARTVGRDGGSLVPVTKARHSRNSGQTWASRWCATRTGWACCMWVRPGMTASPARLAWPTEGLGDIEDAPGQVAMPP